MPSLVESSLVPRPLPLPQARERVWQLARDFLVLVISLSRAQWYEQWYTL